MIYSWDHLIILFEEGVVGDTTTLDFGIVWVFSTGTFNVLFATMGIMLGVMLGSFIGDGTITLDSSTVGLF